jgi:hypothetical protein
MRQDAAGYDENSGWSRLADKHGFVLLYPEQQSSNNPNLCFYWFSPDDASRGKGEAFSIRQMVATVTARQDIDPRRVFVSGRPPAVQWRRRCGPPTRTCSQEARSLPDCRSELPDPFPRRSTGCAGTAALLP